MSDFDDQDYQDYQSVPSDDDAVEITDLEPADEVSTKHTMRTMHMPVPPQFPRQITPRRFNLTLRFAVVLSILLLVVIVLPNGFMTLSSISSRALDSVLPSPTPALPSGYNEFYLDTAIAGTHVVIDGHTVRLPRIGVDAPLTMQPGRHIITWFNNPFESQSCTLSIPFKSSDTCNFAYERATYHTTQFQVILLNESLASLSSEQGVALEQDTQTALDQIQATETVQPGELITGINGPVAALQPLKATLHFRLDTDDFGLCPDFATMLAANGIPCQVEKQSCELLCTIPWQARQTNTLANPIDNPAHTSFTWLTFALTNTAWDYTTLKGQPVGLQQPLGADSSLLGRQIVLLQIMWNSGWHVQVLLGDYLQQPIYVSVVSEQGMAHVPSTAIETMAVGDDPACATALGYAKSGMTTAPVLGSTRHVDIRLISSSNPALGCLIAVESGHGNLNPQQPGKAAYYLVRFGVFLTANTLAHLLRPEVPYADARALQVAQQLELLPGQNISLDVGDV